MKKALVYLQDIGGTNYLLPILSFLNEDNKLSTDFLFVIHPLSQAIMKDTPFIEKVDSTVSFPADNDFWASYFYNNSIDYVICTLSSVKFDKSNAKLILMAKKLKIPVLGFLDHWKGFERLFDSNANPSYVPDWLGVVDNYAVDKLMQLNPGNCVVRALGHPFFEKVIVNNCSNHNKSKKILLVSQPNTKSEDYESLYETEIQGIRLIDILVNKINDSSMQYDIYYRPHPKEKKVRFLPDTVTLDVASKENLFTEYDTFIGFDSSLLFEATLAQCYSISLTMPEFVDVYEDKMPYSFSANVSDLQELPEIIQNRRTDTITLKPELFIGSVQRCVSYIDEFLNQMDIYA